MSEQPTRFRLVRALFTGTGFAIGVFGTIWLTGQTFGQRCADAFPDSAYEQQRCVHEMSNGDRSYPLERGPHHDQ